jgi:hypothetical protein
VGPCGARMMFADTHVAHSKPRRAGGLGAVCVATNECLGGGIRRGQATMGVNGGAGYRRSALKTCATRSFTEKGPTCAQESFDLGAKSRAFFATR